MESSDKTHKEKIYEIVKKSPPGKPLSMKKIVEEVGCTLGHLSILFRMAKDVGFLRMHKSGEYCVSEIPKDYLSFNEILNKRIREHRKAVKGTGTPRKFRPGFGAIPTEISKDNILSVITELIKKAQKLDDLKESEGESYENLKKKYKALLKVTKKYKSENEVLKNLLKE